MADSTTFDEYFRIGRNAMLVNQAALRASDIDTPGTQVNALVALGAAMAEEVSAAARRDWVDSWLGSAEGAALRRLCRDRYRVEAKLASFSYGSVEFSIPSALSEAVVIDIGTEVANTRGVAYRTTTQAVVPVGAVGPISADIVSLTTGPQSASGPGTILSLRTSIGTTVTVTNQYATAGGEPEEDDATLRARTIDSQLGEGKGTAEAIIKAARAVPGVTSAALYEITGALGVPERVAHLFITDAFTEDLIITAPNGSSAYATQSNALTTTVFNALSRVRPIGVPLFVHVAKVRLLRARLAFTYSANANPPRAQEAGVSAFVAYTNLRRPGGRWSRPMARNSFIGIPGLLLGGQEVVYPSGDVVPAYYEVVRTMPSLVAT